MVNMSTEDLQKKYDGNLNSEMIGPLHNLIAKVTQTPATQEPVPGYVKRGLGTAQSVTNLSLIVEFWMWCI